MRARAGVLAGVVAMTGLFVSPGVGAAQEGPVDVDLIPLEGSLTPTTATAGATVTVESVDDCSGFEYQLDWAVFEAGTYSWDDAGTDAVPVDAGSFNGFGGGGWWDVTFPAPAPGAPTEGEPFLPADTLRSVSKRPLWETGPRSLEVYGPLAFEVEGAAYEWFAYCFDVADQAWLEAEITSHEPHPDYGFPIVDPADPAVVVSPIDLCARDGSLVWQVESVPLDEGQVGEVVDGGRFELLADGGWELSFPPPGSGTPAAYVVWLDCLRWDGSGGAQYHPLVFGVDVPAGPELPTEPPLPSAPLPRPAQPVVTDPGYTG